MSTDIIKELEIFLETEPAETALQAWLKQLPPEQYFECTSFLIRRGPNTFIRVMNPEYAVKNSRQLSDEQLLEQLAAALLASLDSSSGKIGLLDPRTHPGPMNQFASLFNEAVSRGYQRDDIGYGMRPYLLAAKNLMKVPGDPVWKSFEKLVARIHTALFQDAEVKWSERLLDASGTIRQIDVTIRPRSASQNSLGIVQCKYQKRPVSIVDVEAFITTARDLNAGLAIMVSNSGYQEGALAKAKLHGVRLWTLEEACNAGWREEFRVFTLIFPMFHELKFEPPLPPGVIPENTPISFDGIVIWQLGKAYSLRYGLAFAIEAITQRCLPLSCWADFDMPLDSSVEVCGKRFPLQRLSFYFDRQTMVEQQKAINVPTGTVYAFKSTAGEGYTVTDRDLPALNQ